MTSAVRNLIILGLVAVLAGAVAVASIWNGGSSADGALTQPGRPPAEEFDRRFDQFWSWWSGASGRIAAKLDAREIGPLSDEIGARVAAIHPRLSWEIGAGTTGARHHLALSSQGDVELRVLTERWLSRAPPPDTIWEYYAARQPLPVGEWNAHPLGSKTEAIGLSDLRVEFQIDEVRELAHALVFHPAFSSLTEEQRETVTFAALDHVLGEDGVDRWIGEVETETDPIADGRPLAVFVEAVETLSRKATREQFGIVLGQTTDGQPLVATINRALKRIDHLLMDHHLQITIPLQAPTPQGMATEEEATALKGMEEELLGTLGCEAVHIGRETGAGKRVLHFHFPKQGVAETRSRDWARRHADRRIDIAVQSDPRWQALTRWETPLG